MSGAGSAVAVLTDGGASLPGCAASLDVHVVPMNLSVDGRVVESGSVTPREVVELAAFGRVTTSAPSPGAYLEAMRTVGERPVVVVTVSSAMSASHDAARTAASYVPDGRVAVVDSLTAAGAQGLVVLAAARAARTGRPLADVAATARMVAGRVRLVASVERLDHLVRSGRVPRVAARAGRVLGMLPIFELSRGRVAVRRPARSAYAARARILATCRAGAQPGARLRAAVLDAEAPDAAASLLAGVQDLAPDASVDSCPFSPVMLAHTGGGISGLAWWWEGPQSAESVAGDAPRSPWTS